MGQEAFHRVRQGSDYSYPANTTGTTGLINHGTSVQLTAAASTGSTASWAGTCVAVGGTEAGNGTTSATCTFGSLNGTKSATATFTLNQYTVTANASGSGAGSVSSSPAGINYSYPANNTGTTEIDQPWDTGSINSDSEYGFGGIVGRYLRGSGRHRGRQWHDISHLHVWEFRWE